MGNPLFDIALARLRMLEALAAEPFEKNDGLNKILKIEQFNEFFPEIVFKTLKKHSDLWSRILVPGDEESGAIYISPSPGKKDELLKVIKKLDADEVDDNVILLYRRFVRVWWD